MSKIKSGLAEDQHTFVINLEGVTIEKLRAYCSVFEIKLGDLDVGEGRYYVPGHYFLGLFRSLIPVIHENDSKFPLKTLTSFNMSTGSTLENRILVDQPIVLKIQTRTREGNKEICWVEFVRKFDDEVVLSGIFGFIGKHH